MKPKRASCSIDLKHSNIKRNTILLSLVVMISGCNSLKMIYLSEIGRSITESPIKKGDFYTKDDFSALPLPLQKYFRNCGYIGKEKIENIKIDYCHSFIKMAPEKRWLKIDYYQVNFTRNPTRLAYISNKILGIFPFEGRDKYQDGKGNMTIRLLKTFTVADAKGKEMDKSALVTLLGDVPFMPGLVTDPRMEWKSIDDYAVEAKISDKGNVVTGIFYFNDNHEYIRFTTEDRYYSQKDGGYQKVKWSVELSDFKEINGIKFPENVKVIWHFDDEDFAYFKAQIKDVQYNINEPSTNPHR